MTDGENVGIDVGLLEGELDGRADGERLGAAVGSLEGARVGVDDGDAVGSAVGGQLSTVCTRALAIIQLGAVTRLGMCAR